MWAKAAIPINLPENNLNISQQEYTPMYCPDCLVLK